MPESPSSCPPCLLRKYAPAAPPVRSWPGFKFLSYLLISLIPLSPFLEDRLAAERVFILQGGTLRWFRCSCPWFGFASRNGRPLWHSRAVKSKRSPYWPACDSRPTSSIA